MTLKMNDINDEYTSILKDYGLSDSYANDHRKHLKNLLQNSIPGLSILPSVRRNESATVSLDMQVSQAMDFAESHSNTIETLSTVAKDLREEALGYRDWKFETSLDGSKCPPKLMFLLNQIRFGRFGKKCTGKRDLQLQKTMEVACQFILQNIRTDRQVKHEAKKDEGFQDNVETPMNIGLPLAIHNKSRDKRSVQIFKELGIGRDY